MNSLVTIDEYDKSHQAQVAVLALEQAGIQSYLQNETIVSMDWFMANAVGGIQLQVAIGDVERATKVLAEIQSARQDREASNKDRWVAFRCGRCKKLIAFSGASLGRVETCPMCGKYVDVPQESDPSLEEETVASTILQSKESGPNFSGSFGNTTYLVGEIFFVLCVAYFRDLYSAIQWYGGFFDASLVESEYADIIAYQETLFQWLWSRSLFVIACMAPVLFLNGIKKPDAQDRIPSWWSSFAVGVLLGLVAFCATWLVWKMQAQSEWAGENNQPWVGMRSLLITLASLTAAIIANSVAEELVMRAYLIDRLERLFGKTWPAVLIAAMMFGSYHLYQGLWVGFFGGTLIGVFFGCYFARYRRLFPLIVAHTILNLLCAAVFWGIVF